MCSNRPKLTAIGIILAVLLSALPVWGAKPHRPYKIYTIKKYSGSDIICDFYTVQRGDYVWDLLRRKGRISANDFPRFISILKHFNPHIKNVHKIYPGQKILVPLKQVAVRKKAPDVKPRYITIPIIPDILYTYHEVRSGDSLSGIIEARFGLEWDRIPEDYLKILQRLNPDIKDMNMVYPGQQIRIPGLAAKEPGHAMPPGKQVPASRGSAGAAPAKSTAISAAKPLPTERGAQHWHQVLSETVAGIEGYFLDSGRCYFPVKGKPDLCLDLSEYPIIELADGRYVLLDKGKGLPHDVEEVIRCFWKDLVIISMATQDADAVVLDRVVGAIFGGKVERTVDLPVFDDGVKVTLRGDWIMSQSADKGPRPAYKCITLIEDPRERTSAALVEYLARRNIRVVDILIGPRKRNKVRPFQKNALKGTRMFTIDGSGQEAFVSGFTKALGYSYEPGVPISFDYAGFQVQTTANLIHGGDGLDLVVDFGTFYGDAKSSVESRGLKVISIGTEDGLLSIARNILDSIGIAYSDGPGFWAADRKLSKSASLAVPGLLVSHSNGKRDLLTRVAPHPRLCDFLREKKIRVLKIKEWG